MSFRIEAGGLPAIAKKKLTADAIPALAAATNDASRAAISSSVKAATTMLDEIPVDMAVNVMAYGHFNDDGTGNTHINIEVVKA